jgi:hypothetical protein
VVTAEDEGSEDAEDDQREQVMRVHFTHVGILV